MKLEGAKKYFNTLSKERGDRFKSKSEQVTCKAIFKGNFMLCSHANLKTRKFHANCFEYFLFHFYLLVLVRVLSSERIFELSHAISQRPCRLILPLQVTENYSALKYLVRSVLSQSKHEKTIWDHSCNIDKSTFHFATGRRVPNSLSIIFLF